MVDGSDPNRKKYFATLKYTVDRSNGGTNKGYSTATQDETIPLFAITNASNRITSCYSQTSAAQMCIDMGGTYNASGTPKCTLSSASVCADMGGTYSPSGNPKCRVPGPDIKIGTPTIQGWGKFEPYSADPGGNYTKTFEGECPTGYRAITCLFCVAAGCTPNISMMNQSLVPSGWGVNATQTNATNAWTKLQLRWVQAITKNPTGPADPTKGTRSLQMQWEITPPLPYNGTMGSGHWPYGPGTRGAQDYAIQTGNYLFMRVAPVCQKM